jgi:cell division inhibitor SepF
MIRRGIMVSILEKVSNLIGLGAEEEYEGDEYGEEEGAEEPEPADRRRGSGQRGTPQVIRDRSNVVNFNEKRGAPESVLVSAKPEKFSDAQAVCEHLKDRHIVIFNLEEVDSELAQKIVDFVSGAVYALDAEIIKFSRSLFGVAPSNVDLLTIKEDPKGRGFLAFGSGSYRG